MAGWDEIVRELGQTKNEVDYVRAKYVDELAEYTGRNVICYYSAFINKSSPGTDINDDDMNGFMNSVRGMDCSKGLDLILHTPGGDPTAAESIVKYLRNKFNGDIRVIVPHIAMSAGTMIACASKKIVMGKHSSLGPIDPQFGGIPAYNIKSEFEEAKDDLSKNPQHAQYWMIQLQKYPAAFVKQAIDAIALSEELVKDWLGSGMFDSNNQEDVVIIDKIVNSLNEHDSSKAHGRHLDIDFCKKIGLKITELESYSELQDKIMSVHHCFMISLNGTSAVKIIQSQNDKTWIKNSN